MRNIALVGLLFFSLFGFSQIEVVKEDSKIKEVGVVKSFGQEHLSVKKIGNKYIFRYVDNKFQTLDDYKEFYFENTNNDFENLYNLISSKLEAKATEKVDLKINSGLLTLDFLKVMGVPQFRFFHTDLSGVTGVSVYLTKKKLDKLFGKKKKKR